MTTLLVALMGVLTIIAATRESYAYCMGNKKPIKQDRYMRNTFAGARKKLDAAHAAEDQREILHALGEAALTEHAEWALMHRARPPKHGKLCRHATLTSRVIARQPPHCADANLTPPACRSAPCAKALRQRLAQRL
ncbi:MAG TPA: hypothetical protein VLZ55_00315 [Rhodanobacter sp.]|nr:hypothetical protein [Rhodanobacter sp.]